MSVLSIGNRGTAFPRSIGIRYLAAALCSFLEACDIVKYAAFTPRREDADDALRSARVFVDATAAAARQSARHAEPEGRAA